MNKTFLGFMAGAVLGGGAVALLRHALPAAAPAETAAAKPEEKPNPLRIAAARRQQMGLQLGKPESIALDSEVTGYGRVLDPAPLLTLAAEIETAQVAVDASTKELERVRKLFAAGGNASGQAVETAEANAARDRAALNSARTRLAAAWGPQIASDPAALTSALVKGATLARIDLLPDETPAAEASEAQVDAPGRAAAIVAHVIGPAPTADAQLQGPGFLVLIPAASGLPAGASFRGRLPGAGDAVRALVVPRRAVVYHQGSAWVFVLGEEDTFERRLVTPGRAVGADRMVIAMGIEADDSLAVAGTQQLLAAELQAGGVAEEP